MSFLWVVTGAALVVAVAAWVMARRALARLGQLSEMHWELKYQHLEMRKQMDRLAGPEQALPSPAPPAPKDSFVPLTSLRR